MKIATQADIDAFLASIIMDEKFYPYLTTATFFEKWEEYKSDWHGVSLTDKNLSYFLKISFDRSRGQIEFNVSLYSKNEISTLKALIGLRYLIKRYNPKAINTVVHASNRKSLELHTRIMGAPWGIEPMIAWNSLLGKFEDLHYFRKLL